MVFKHMNVRREDTCTWNSETPLHAYQRSAGVRMSSNYKKHFSYGEIQMQRNKLECYCSNPGNHENILLKCIHKFDNASLGLKEK